MDAPVESRPLNAYQRLPWFVFSRLHRTRLETRVHQTLCYSQTHLRYTPGMHTSPRRPNPTQPDPDVLCYREHGEPLTARLGSTCSTRNRICGLPPKIFSSSTRQDRGSSSGSTMPKSWNNPSLPGMTEASSWVCSGCSPPSLFFPFR